MRKFLTFLIVLTAPLMVALAGPKPGEIERLGGSGDLTPMGSPKAGNEDGTIPAWTGGITEPPAGYSKGDHHPDPFPDDEILFVINGSNYQQYADKLSVGQQRMFERYPDTFYMNIYPTRRTVAFPQRVYDATKRNGATATTVNDGEGVIDASVGFPFPFPETAKELIWNHKLKYKSTGGVRYNNQAAATAGGSYNLVVLREEFLGPYYKEGAQVEDINNILLYFFQEVEAPARLAGSILLVHETLNQVSSRDRPGSTIPVSAACVGPPTSLTTIPAPHPTICAPPT